jgi:flagellar hook-basal body complex protein FliE
MAKTDEKTKAKTNATDRVAPKPSPAAAEMADTGSVDKIRDILFGNQMRDFERRFSQMEDRLVKATMELRDETQKRMEALEVFFNKELEALKHRVKAESEERADGDSRLNDELKSASSTLKKGITQVEEKLSESSTELRQQILEQSKSLTAEIQSKSEKASESLHSSTSALDEAKIDRSALAEYFIEMAMHLSNRSGENPSHSEKN